MNDWVWMLAFACCGGIANGQGSFHYVSFEQPLPIFGATELDLNQDGRSDLSIEFQHATTPEGDSWAFWFQGRLVDGMRVLTDSYYFTSPSILQSGVSTISLDFPVRQNIERPSGTSPMNWLENTALGSFSLGGISNSGEWGIYSQTRSIIGFQIKEEDGYHNGWVRFEQRKEGSVDEMFIVDWAYNLRAGESILAGTLQVPEPRTLLMFVLGSLILLCTRCWRKSVVVIARRQRHEPIRTVWWCARRIKA